MYLLSPKNKYKYCSLVSNLVIELGHYFQILALWGKLYN